MYLFVYGCLNEKVVKKVTGKNKSYEYRSARLPNHMRRYYNYSDVWKGPVANVEHCQGNDVIGAVLQVDTDDLEKIDKYEWRYEKRRKYVVLKNGERILAFVYFLKDKHMTEPATGPSRKYAIAIAQLARL
jgi:gamma-glutamylcyclotransferase (GGCT)/AIG2-like uncharacterized protein YtfP